MNFYRKPRIDPVLYQAKIDEEFQEKKYKNFPRENLEIKFNNLSQEKYTNGNELCEKINKPFEIDSIQENLIVIYIQQKYFEFYFYFYFFFILLLFLFHFFLFNFFNFQVGKKWGKKLSTKK